MLGPGRLPEGREEGSNAGSEEIVREMVALGFSEILPKFAEIPEGMTRASHA